MHKTSKNQTRYKLDKKTINQEGTHKSDKQTSYPNYIKKPKSTHDWGNQNDKILKENKIKE